LPCETFLSTAIYIGVHLRKKQGRWEAEITQHREKIWLGSFDNKIDTAKAYNDAAVKHHCEFASLNFPILTKSPCGPNPLRFLPQQIIMTAGSISRLVKPVRLRSERVVGRTEVAINVEKR
jgi:hypothetical protein